MLAMLLPTTLPTAMPGRLGESGLQAGHQLRRRGAEADECYADEERRQAERPRQGDRAAHQGLAAQDEQDETCQK